MTTGHASGIGRKHHIATGVVSEYGFRGVHRDGEWFSRELVAEPTVCCREELNGGAPKNAGVAAAGRSLRPVRVVGEQFSASVGEHDVSFYSDGRPVAPAFWSGMIGTNALSTLRIRIVDKGFGHAKPPSVVESRLAVSRARAPGRVSNPKIEREDDCAAGSVGTVSYPCLTPVRLRRRQASKAIQTRSRQSRTVRKSGLTCWDAGLRGRPGWITDPIYGIGLKGFPSASQGPVDANEIDGDALLGGSQAVLLTDERFLGTKNPVKVDGSLLVLPEDQLGEAVGGLDAFRQGPGLCLGLQEGHDCALQPLRRRAALSSDSRVPSP